KSEDGGGSWSPVNSGLTNLNVQTLAIDPDDTQIIYAGTDSGSLFISMDGGGSWAEISDGIAGANVLSVAIDPVATTTLYAGTAGEGLFKLTQRGESGGTTGGSGGGCFIESAAYGFPVSRQVPLDHGVAAVMIVAISLVTTSIAVLYLLKRLRLHGALLEVAKVKRRLSNGMPVLRRK
ncbi:MAG: hypothetical protein P8075_19310, partial [Deltaproteobacteria bacterium]